MCVLFIIYHLHLTIDTGSMVNNFVLGALFANKKKKPICGNLVFLFLSGRILFSIYLKYEQISKKNKYERVDQCSHFVATMKSSGTQ